MRGVVMAGVAAACLLGSTASAHDRGEQRRWPAQYRHAVYTDARPVYFARVDKHAWKALQRMSLSVKAVTEMDYLVNVKKLTPEYAVRNWMAAHPDTVNYWLQPDPEE